VGRLIPLAEAGISPAGSIRLILAAPCSGDATDPAPITDCHDPVFKDARFQPFLDEADYARIIDPVLQETNQLSLANRFEVGPNVRIENKVHLFGGDPDHERIQRVVLSALRSEPV
jgi:hypothetical protein